VKFCSTLGDVSVRASMQLCFGRRQRIPFRRAKFSKTVLRCKNSDKKILRRASRLRRRRRIEKPPAKFRRQIYGIFLFLPPHALAWSGGANGNIFRSARVRRSQNRLVREDLRKSGGACRSRRETCVTISYGRSPSSAASINATSSAGAPSLLAARFKRSRIASHCSPAGTSSTSNAFAPILSSVRRWLYKLFA
jgi:hypothetical protein